MAPPISPRMVEAPMPCGEVRVYDKRAGVSKAFLRVLRVRGSSGTQLIRKGRRGTGGHRQGVAAAPSCLARLQASVGRPADEEARPWEAASPCEILTDFERLRRSACTRSRPVAWP